MKPLLTDPVILICSGIIVVCLLGLVWVLGQFRRLKSPLAGTDSLDAVETAFPFARGLNDQPASASLPMASAAASVPTVSKEMADRLESMTQRLAEMQTLLVKQQSAAPSADTAAVGQGFSPETMDKLLKIIGNVIQQVDILQKNLNPPKDAI